MVARTRSEDIGPYAHPQCRFLRTRAEEVVDEAAVETTALAPAMPSVTCRASTKSRRRGLHHLRKRLEVGRCDLPAIDL
jgi:hypothetical protein